MSERGLWNELLSGVGLKVWTMCLRWSWSRVEQGGREDGEQGGWDRGMGDMERKGKTNPAISVKPCKSM